MIPLDLDDPRSKISGNVDIKEQLKQQGIIIIYQQQIEESSQTTDIQLQNAMKSDNHIIVVEPEGLGEMVSMWITIGNFLHKLTIISGLGVITSACIFKKPYICCCLCITNIFSATLYSLAWQFDPYTKYRVEKNPKKKARFAVLVSSQNPTVLIKDKTQFRNFCRITLTISATSVCLWNFYKFYKMKV